jgi:predicted O-methyltransferase YrrM
MLKKLNHGYNYLNISFANVFMNKVLEHFFPLSYQLIQKETFASGFTMASDPLTGSLLKTLAATKKCGSFLELGTGTGLSTAWILDGMDDFSKLISIDFEIKFLNIARKYLGEDTRVSLMETDGEIWVLSNLAKKFDFIFADTWHGKYLLLDEVLAMLNQGGLYIIDDMLEQPNWPEGHAEKVFNLIKTLESKTDLFLTKLDWSTGIIIAVKK